MTDTTKPEDTPGPAAGSTANGVAKPVTFEAIPSDTRPRRVYRRAFALVDQRTKRLLFATIPMALAASALEAVGLALVLPYIQLLTDDTSTMDDLPSAVRRFADFVGASDVDSTLRILGLSIVGLLVAKTIFTALFTYFQMKVVVRGETKLAINLFDRYMHAPYQFHVHTNSAESIRNVKASISLVMKRVLVPWTQLLTELTLIVVIAAALFVLDPLLPVITGGFLAVVAAVYVAGLSRMSRRLGVIDQRLSKDSLMAMQEGLSGLKALRTLNRESSAVDDFSRVRLEWEPVKHRMMFLNAATRFYLEFCMVLGTAAIVAFVFATSDESRALGLIGVVVAATFRLLPSLNRVLGAINQTKMGAAAVESVEQTIEYLEAFQQADGPVGPGLPIKFESTIRFDNTEFIYHLSDHPAVTNINLSIHRGQSVGLVGPSGSGKSTLVALLLGLVYATDGAIEVDGVPITPSTARSWREHVGYVPQDIYLSDTSLRRNIALGLQDHEIDEVRILAAAETAQLSEFVASLPAGLDTEVGEGGTRLSGGQRQRIGIARALYRRPQVLLLDEATSALDAATEANITQVIENLRGDITMVIVAHRLSTVRKCDTIVHVDSGSIRGQGDFEELLRTDTKFAQLVDLSDLR